MPEALIGVERVVIKDWLNILQRSDKVLGSPERSSGNNRFLLDRLGYTLAHELTSVFELDEIRQLVDFYVAMQRIGHDSN